MKRARPSGVARSHPCRATSTIWRDSGTAWATHCSKACVPSVRTKNRGHARAAEQESRDRVSLTWQGGLHAGRRRLSGRVTVEAEDHES
jgi:hypothetical protein